MGKGKRGIYNIVFDILQNDKKARNSDRYLYIEVIKRVNPQLSYEPFAIAMANANIVCFETVRRSRQLCQARFPSLKANATVQGFREEEEKEYRELAGYAR